MNILKKILLFSYDNNEEIKKAFELVRKHFSSYYEIDFQFKEYKENEYDAIIFLKRDRRDISANNKLFIVEYFFESIDYYAVFRLLTETFFEIPPIDDIDFDIKKVKKDNISLLEENSSYVERKALEETLLEAIKNEQIVSVVSVLGYGGIGKTRLVKHILNKLKDIYTIIWIEILNESDIEEIVLNKILNYILRINGKEVKERRTLFPLTKYILKTLKKEYSNLLFVIDSAERNKVVSETLISYLKGFKVIATSREDFINAKRIELTGMQENEAFELYEKRKGKNITKDEKLLKEYFKQIDYLPLGIELLASIENLSKINNIFEIKEVRKKLKFIFDYIYNHLNKDEKFILRIIGLLSTIQKKEIDKILEEKNKKIYVDKIILHLKHRYLVKSMENNIYYLHPLIREFVMSSFEEDLNSLDIYLILVNFYRSKISELKNFVIRTLKDFDEFTDKYITFLQEDREKYKEIIYNINEILFYLGYFNLLRKAYLNIEDFINLADIYSRINKKEEAIEYIWNYIKYKNIDEIFSEKNGGFYLYLLLYNIVDVLFKNKKDSFMLEKILGFSLSSLNYLYEKYKKLEDDKYLSIFGHFINLIGVIFHKIECYSISKNIFESNIFLMLRIDNVYNLINALNLYIETLIKYDNSISMEEMYKKIEKFYQFIDELEEIEIGEDKKLDLKFLLLFTKILSYFETNNKKLKLENELKDFKNKESEITLSTTDSELLNNLLKLINKKEDIVCSENLKKVEPYFCALINAYKKEKIEYYDFKQSELFSIIEEKYNIRSDFLNALKEKNKEKMREAIEKLNELEINPIYEKLFYYLVFNERYNYINNKKDNKKRKDIKFCNKLKCVNKSIFEKDAIEKCQNVVNKFKKIFNFEEKFFTYPLILKKIDEDIEDKDLLKVSEIEAVLLKDCLNIQNDNEEINIIANSILLKSFQCKHNFYNYIKNSPNKEKLLNKLKEKDKEFINIYKENKIDKDLFLLTYGKSEYLKQSEDSVKYKPYISCDEKIIKEIYQYYKER